MPKVICINCGEPIDNGPPPHECLRLKFAAEDKEEKPSACVSAMVIGGPPRRETEDCIPACVGGQLSPKALAIMEEFRKEKEGK